MLPIVPKGPASASSELPPTIVISPPPLPNSGSGLELAFRRGMFCELTVESKVGEEPALPAAKRSEKIEKRPALANCGERRIDKQKQAFRKESLYRAVFWGFLEMALLLGLYRGFRAKMAQFFQTSRATNGQAAKQFRRFRKFRRFRLDNTA